MISKISQKTLAIIPARYSSTRFPGKPLAEILGKSMIQHVWERAMQTNGIDEVLIATDDERILRSVEKFGGSGVLTSSNHKTGTFIKQGDLAKQQLRAKLHPQAFVTRHHHLSKHE